MLKKLFSNYFTLTLAQLKEPITFAPPFLGKMDYCPQTQYLKGL